MNEDYSESTSKGSRATYSTDVGASKKNGHRILIMDDEETILDTVSRMIALFNLGDVAKAREGGEALDIYRQALSEGKPFDLVIMDLTVKEGLGGRDAIRELLKIDPRARAVVSSGYAGDPLVLNFQKYGFIGALVKPYTMDDLRKLLTSSLT